MCDLYDEVTAKELDAISSMVKQAEQAGMLVEVIYSLAGSLNSSNKDIAQECRNALYEWDC